MKHITGFEKRRYLLLQAVKIFGSQTELARQVGIDRHHYNRCVTGELEIPLHHAIKLQKKTKGKIRVKDILPAKYKETAAIIEEWSSKAENTSNYLVPSSSIRTGKLIIDPQAISQYYLNRPVILEDMHNNFFYLAGGSRSFYAQQSYGRDKIQAKVFNFYKSLIENIAALKKDLKESRLLISEKVEIGKYIEALIGNRQGKRSDLKNNSQLVKNFSQVNFDGKRRFFIANLLNFGNGTTYYQAKKIIACGSNLLIEAVDRQIISISKAANLIEIPQRELLELIENKIQQKNLVVEPEFFNHWRFVCR